MGNIVIVPLGHDAFGPHSVNDLIIDPHSVGSDVIVSPYGWYCLCPQPDQGDAIVVPPPHGGH